MDGGYRECGTFIPSYVIEKQGSTHDISSAEPAHAARVL